MCILCLASGFPGAAMAAPAPSTPSRAGPSADVRAILGNEGAARWNIEAPLGTPVVVTWSLPTQAESWDDPSFRGMSPDFAAHIHRALETWADASGLTFVQVDPGLGDIRFSLRDMSGLTNSRGSQLKGFAYYPQTGWTYDANGQPADLFVVHNGIGGDVFLNQARFGSSGTIAPGTFGYSLLLHEIGHAIGLKHPFEGDPVITPSHDNGSYTVLSYNRPDATTRLGSVDVEATRYLYGSGEVNARWNDRADRVEITGGRRGEWLLGTGLDDRIAGNGGHDRMLGKLGDDRLLGGAGRDSLDGADGADRLLGQGGNDSLSGGAGDDTLAGGPGRDTLDGGDGNDRLSGQGGKDVLIGNLGDDRLVGGGGNDSLQGTSGADTLKGDAGRDTLDGGSGDNLLIGGAGNDHLTGGYGADTFRFAAGSGFDRITDFSGYGGDRLELAGRLTGGPVAASDLVESFGTLIADRAALRFAGGEVIQFTNFTTLHALDDALSGF